MHFPYAAWLLLVHRLFDKEYCNSVDYSALYLLHTLHLYFMPVTHNDNTIKAVHKQ